MEVFELKKDTIYQYLKKEIISGRLQSGKQLPCETELSKSLGVGKITLRDSLARLEHEGFIKRIHGKGTFISPDSAHPTSTATIMVVHHGAAGFELPWHYIVPEIVRCSEKNDLKTFITPNNALEMFSGFEISSFVKANNIVGIAAVMTNFNGDEPILEKLRTTEVPVVMLHASMSDPEITGFAGIAINEREGCEAAVAYLAECGHKNIAVIGCCDKFGFRHHSRQEMLICLEKYHATPDDRLLKPTIFDKESIKGTVRELLSIRPFPSAILCFSDFYAIYVYEALKEMKLRIPEDIAVMGTCGYPDARLLSPPLSTIDYCYAKSAEMAVEMLQHPENWFDAKTGMGKLRIQPFKLRKRQSTELK